MPDYDLDDFLKKKGSPMAGLGHVFTAAGKKYGVDPRLVVAISGIESSFGKHTYGQHNAWGWGPGKSFASWEEGISAVTQGLRNGYLNRGLKTPEKIVHRYAPGSDGNDTGNWVKVVNQFLGELGGAVPVQQKGYATPTLATAPPRVPTQVAGIRAAAMANLGAIASGRGMKPTEQLAALASGALEDHQKRLALQQEQMTVAPDAEALAGKWGGTTQDPGPALSNNPRVAQAIEIAKSQVGKPYVFGSAGPEAFDCSGLIEYAFEQAGLKTPGRLWTGTMSKMGQSVPWNRIKPGDWVVRHSGGSGHVVMYVGNGKVIAAPHKGEVVQYQDLKRFQDGRYQVRRWSGTP